MSLINDALKRANQAQKQNSPDRPKLAPLQAAESRKPGIDWASYLLPGLLAIVLMAAGAFLWSWASSRRSSGATETLKTPPAVAVATAPEPPKAPPTAATKPVVKISTNVVVRPTVQVVKPAQVASVLAPEAAPPSVTTVQPPERPVVTALPAPASTIPTPPAPPQTATVVPPPPVVSPPSSRPVAAIPEPPIAVTPRPALQPAPVVPPPAAVGSETPVTAVSPPSATAPAAVVKPVVVEAPKPEFPHLKVQGIVFRRTNPSVFINGKSCYVGDVIEGARVTRIERLSVFVEFGGQTKELNMEP